jgi:hypothetical protein
MEWIEFIMMGQICWFFKMCVFKPYFKPYFKWFVEKWQFKFYWVKGNFFTGSKQKIKVRKKSLKTRAKSIDIKIWFKQGMDL